MSRGSRKSDAPAPTAGSVILPSQITHCPISELKPYERNSRTHTPAQIEKIAASLKEFGWTNPVLVDGDRGIIAGHARVLAAASMGMTSVPVIELKHLSEAQKRAYIIADNRLALDAGWDEEILEAELKALAEMDFDLELTGFNADELHTYLDDEAQEEIPTPEPPDDAVSKPGDIWILGEHRLMNGNSGVDEDVDRLLNGAEVHLVHTDPPYNVAIQSRTMNSMAAGTTTFPKEGSSTDVTVDRKMRAKDRAIANDDMDEEQYARMLASWFGNIHRVLMPGRSFYIWGGYANCGNYPPVLAALELHFSQAIIWVKGSPVMNRKDFMGNHEWCFYGWKKGAAHTWLGPKNVTDVWDVKKVPHQRTVHITEKPVELGVRAMKYSTHVNENVLDLFGGSGSTLIAAENTKRKAFVMELDPLYVDVIIQRWQNATGEQATLDGDGRTYAEIASERLPAVAE